jgi:hypothetical protein
VQEIVNRGSWATGNDMVIFWDDHAGASTATANTYRGMDSNDTATVAPVLHVDYVAPTYDITNAPTSKAFSVIAANTTYYAKGTAPSNPVVDGDCTYSVTNDGNVPIDVSIHTHNYTGGVGWTVASNAGVDTVKMVAYKTGDNPASGVVLTTSGQAFISNLAAAGHTHWDFSLLTGTFTDGVAKTTTITLTSTVH